MSTINWPQAEDLRVDLVSVHLDFLSHAERQRELETLTTILESRDNLRIIMGDFNMEYDKRRNALLPKLTAALNLHTWKPHDKKMTTYPKLSKRLDWVLVSREFKFTSYEVLEDRISDHRPVIARVTLANNRPGEVD